MFNESEKATIVNKVKTFLHSIKVVEDSDNLNRFPFMQIIPKFHKPVLKFRTIIASKNCITTKLSRIIFLATNLIETRMKNYCSTIGACTNLNLFWIIKNNEKILTDLARLSKNNRAQTIDTYDFTTLYTNIKHDDLFRALQFVISTAFSSSRFSRIRISEYSTRWCTCDTGFSLSEQQLLQSIKFLVENTWFTVGKHLFNQIIGIPMGTNCAPNLANLFLFALEFRFLKSNLRNDYALCMSLKYTYRYLDDITVINCNNRFDQVILDMYGNDLDLCKVNSVGSHADVLDLSISIVNKKFVSKLYDKRRDFNFTINAFPFFASNISRSILYGTFYAQVIRYCRICSEPCDAIREIISLKQALLMKGYEEVSLISTLRKAINKHVLVRTCFHGIDLSTL